MKLKICADVRWQTITANIKINAINKSKMEKKKALFIALAIGMMGCDESNVEIKSTKYFVGDYINPLKEMEIEGCQYLFGDWNQSTILTHKGNCNNPIHKHNGSSHE